MNTVLPSQGLLSMIVINRKVGLQYQAQPSFSIGRLCGVCLPLEEIQAGFNKIFMAIKTG